MKKRLLQLLLLSFVGMSVVGSNQDEGRLSDFKVDFTTDVWKRRLWKSQTATIDLKKVKNVAELKKILAVHYIIPAGVDFTFIDDQNQLVTDWGAVTDYQTVHIVPDPKSGGSGGTKDE